MKRMLINATQEEELRLAMVDGQRLYDLNIEGPASERKKANIYKGKITRIEPSLEAAFVDYGADRHGFLPLKEISSEYFVKQPESGGKPNIKEVLKEGQDIVVQIDKEERGNKGAALTTFVSLAGRFIVLKPNKDRSGGVSRRIVGADRDLARKSLNDVEVPKGMSVILRTAGIDRSAEELAWDLENLLNVWQAILSVVLERPSPFLIYRESNAVIRALRDYLTNEIGEILIDDEGTWKEAQEFIEQVMPHNIRKLKKYTDPVPLFTRFQIESQIESAFAHSVTLPSGGSIVIDHTEALVSIDINSARATKGGDIEATALNTNLEAAEEVARQLRIRDLGGLVVIDFIDMGPAKNQREVENRLRESVRQDRARVQIGKITRFGLLEMSRQRLRPSIGESAYQTCPRCSGFGTIRSIESLALAILRIVGEEARKERTAKVIAQLPVEVATYLLNEKRDWVRSLETSHDTQVVLVANSALETPHYDVRRVRDDQIELPENIGVSYSLAEVETEADVPQSIEERKIAEPAAVGVIKPATPAPVRQPERVGFWAWLTGLFAGDDKPKSKKKTKKKTPQRKAKSQSRRGRGGRDQQRSRGRGGERKQADDRPRSKKKASKKKTAKKTAKKTGSASKPRRQQDQDAGDSSNQQGQQAQKPEEAQGEQKRPSRSRRSRGGRRRRRSGERRDGQPQDAQQSEATSTTEQSKPAADAKPTPQDKPKATSTTEQSKPAADTKPAQQSKPEATSTTEQSKPAADAKPAQQSKPEVAREEQQSAPDTKSGPPRARTDAERAADAVEQPPASQDTAQAAEKPAGKPRPDAKPAPESEPPREEASEASAAQDNKPAQREESKSDEPKQPPKEKPAASPKPRATDSVSAEPATTADSGNGKPAATEPKPGGRLLPWEPEPQQAPKEPAAPAAKPEAGDERQEPQGN